MATTGPTTLNITLQKGESRTVTLTLKTVNTAGTEATMALTGKTIRLRANIDNTWVLWDNSTNGGLTLAADQTANKGECDVAFTNAKGTGTQGTWPYEVWDVSAIHNHIVGDLIIKERKGT